MSILKVTNMSQGFGDRQIFNDVSFNLLNGEHIGLVGANGEGKTTFLKLITNEILPDQGT
ncbi:ATP-binding cassette domain-containing protein, partial [Clostridium perfringens]